MDLSRTLEVWTVAIFQHRLSAGFESSPWGIWCCFLRWFRCLTCWKFKWHWLNWLISRCKCQVARVLNTGKNGSWRWCFHDSFRQRDTRRTFYFLPKAGLNRILKLNLYIYSIFIKHDSDEFWSHLIVFDHTLSYLSCRDMPLWSHDPMLQGLGMLMIFSPFLSAVVPGYKQTIAVMLMMWHGCNDMQCVFLIVFTHAKKGSNLTPGGNSALQNYVITNNFLLYHPPKN